MSLRKFLFAFMLAALAAAPAFSQVRDTVSLPDSLWDSADTVVWVRKVPYYCEGPAYEAATGAVYFTQQIGNNAPNWPIWRVVPGVDTGNVWYSVKQNNGIAFDPKGRLVVCQNGQLSRLKPDLSAPGSGMLDTVLTTFGSTVQSNDLAIGKAGDIYFSGYSDNNVYYLNPEGARTTVATGVNSSNGIEWPQALDSNGVYVNASGSNLVYRYERDPVTGALSNRTNFLSVTTPDGGAVDSRGNRYVASYNTGEIRVFNAVGVQLGRIALRKQSGIYDSVQSAGRRGRQGNADNCVFGGSDLKTLYITGDGGLFSIRLKVAGIPAANVTALRGRALVPAHPISRETDPRDVRGRLLAPDAKTPAVRAPVPVAR